MSFDYNSFLIGVQTGLKLGRPPLGRVPPTPTPSGRYILMEDGTPIVTELAVNPYASIYNSNTWYGNIRYRVISSISSIGPIDCKLFFANITSGLTPSALGTYLVGFHFTNDPSLLNAYVYVDAEEELETYWRLTHGFGTGTQYQGAYSDYKIGSSFPKPEGTIIFEGSYDEVINFGWNTQYDTPLPLITE